MPLCVCVRVCLCVCLPVCLSLLSVCLSVCLYFDLQVEFRFALGDLGIELTDTQFAALVNDIDDGSGQIDAAEFRACAAALNLPVGRLARTKIRAAAGFGASALWIVIGMLVFAECEGWSYLVALYFCLITLTTIGTAATISHRLPSVPV